MNEAEARDLAREINQQPGWYAYAGEQPYLNRDNHGWWVWARHESMRSVASTPDPKLPIESRQEWEEARVKWDGSSQQ